MEPSAELEALVRRWIDSGGGSPQFQRALHSRSDYVRQIGSDEHEWAQGFDQVVGDFEEQDERLFAYAGPREVLRLEAYEHGEVGWAAAELKETLESGRGFVYRFTAVFVLEDHVWKIVQSHFSIPVPNEELLAVELTGTLSDLLTSIDADQPSTAFGDAEPYGTVTLLFTDVVDSTAVSGRVGDAAWTRLIGDHFDTVRGIVEREGGSTVKTLGDGGMYVFVSATSALRAGIAIQEAVSASGTNHLDLRVGVHTGEVVRRGDDYLGLTVSKAARVAAAAQGGQILASATTVEMLNTVEFVFGEPIPAELKGIDGTHVLRPLLWDGQRPRNRTTRT